MRPWVKAVLALLAVITPVWIFRIIIEPDIPGVNIYRWSLKWFVFTYLEATTLTLLPFVPIFALGAIATRLSGKKNYETAFYIAFVITVLWAVMGNYGYWYGKCRQSHSVEECR